MLIFKKITLIWIATLKIIQLEQNKKVMPVFCHTPAKGTSAKQV